MKDRILGWGSYKIAEIWGIPIRLHFSLLFYLPLLARSYGWLTGAILELGFIMGIVLHELGHSFVAIRKGCGVRDITMTCIGGAARMEQIPTAPRDEALMAAAGPSVSLAIGLTLIFSGRYVDLPYVMAFRTPEGIEGLNFLEFMGWVNIAWVIFNLIPAFPMDGGRILRAALVPRMGRLKATLWASRIGRFLALAGMITAIRYSLPLLVLISIYIFYLAGQEYRYVAIQEALKHRPSWFGFSPFSFSEKPPRNQTVDLDVDDVTISPPPYENGPEQHTRIRHLPESPFDET